MSISVNRIPSIGIPFTDSQGRINPIWYEFIRAFVASTVEDIPGAEVDAPTVIAGSGLSGGGPITSDVTLTIGTGQGIRVDADEVNVDITNQSLLSLSVGDELLVADTSENNILRKTRISDIINLVEVPDPGINSLIGTDNITVGLGTGEDLITGSIGNTLTGKDAGASITSGDYNVAMGWHALDALTTNSTYGSIAVGADALGAVTTGVANVGIGFEAGNTITTTSHNTIVGTNALTGTASGNSVAIGSLALNGSLVTVNDQVVIGYQAGSRGQKSVHVGYQAGAGTNTTARDQHAGLGYQALFFRSGTNCVGVGYQAGKAGSLSAGDNNTFVGASTGSTSTTGDNNTCIGYQADKSAATAADEFTLGNASVATLRCQQTSITALSDRRDKKDIIDLPLGLDFINKLRPVKFTWNMRDGKRVGQPEAGFIAQELKEASEKNEAEWVGLVLESNPDRLEASPGKLLPIIVKAIQELSSEVYKTNK